MFTLSPFTIIRPEPQGALMFQQETAETALLDTEGLDTLYFLVKGQPREIPIFFVRYLRQKGFIVPGPADGALTVLEEVRDLAPHTTAPPRSLSAPETIHFSVTGRCDQACAGCFYSARPGSAVTARDAPWELFEKVVRQAARVRVFQMALGGGEPLLHPRLLDMVRLAREQGIVPNLTTNGNLLSRDLAQALKEAGLGQVQISLNGADEDINALTRPNYQATMRAIENCRAAGLRWGINFLLTRSNLHQLAAVIELGRRLGAASINLLRPKPPTTEGDWLARESPTAADYRTVQAILQTTIRNPKDHATRNTQHVTRNTKGLGHENHEPPGTPTRITLDASLTFLLTDQPPQQLYRQGVWGCCAARKFVTITQDGDVLPCSHVRWSDTDGGDFMRAWWESEVFAHFRAQEELMRGRCRGCPYLELCKGCRAVVMAFGGDFAASDPHCPRR